jgi:transcriptional antiterminator RfaH
MSSSFNNTVANTTAQITDAPRWYLLQCKPLQQARAELNLQQQGFTFYAPEHAVQRLRRGRVDVGTEALFPGYVFIQLDSQSNWRALRATKGVSRVVGFGDRPLAVPDALIAALQARLQTPAAPVALYKAGDRVLITEGCFKHIEAIVQAVTPQQRIVVLLNILNTQQAVRMPLAAVTLAG